MNIPPGGVRLQAQPGGVRLQAQPGGFRLHARMPRQGPAPPVHQHGPSTGAPTTSQHGGTGGEGSEPQFVQMLRNMLQTGSQVMHWSFVTTTCHPLGNSWDSPQPCCLSPPS